MKSRVIFASLGLIVATAIPAVAATIDDSSAARLVVDDSPSSDAGSSTATPVDVFDGFDISGNCDEAEHFNDPECNGTAPTRIDDHGDSSRDDHRGQGRGRGRGRGGDDDRRDDSDDRSDDRDDRRDDSDDSDDRDDCFAASSCFGGEFTFDPLS